ncbi:3'-5' exonuclease [Effusibacillus lacus]|uniref:DNA polymerase III subunit epsilon n=1 Tax=Effusibacillus lacus TaxID=1348429 RepID=A0A292YKQ4_9BACL|nr:exonuclease domain-containing protein [Effusibacillus lacus]TCS73619.1 DNA polymerase-3 subunit epsilon [Effusibacillus lacus]GAX89489.1 DNA polymerase III subunit epsilon [Effusibacillus lacus]
MIRKAIDQLIARLYGGPQKLPPDVTLETIEMLRQLIVSHDGKSLADQQLTQLRFVVFDTETTGFYPFAGDEIISLSAVTVENKEIRENPAFDSLVNPYRQIPEVVTNLTGISKKQVDQAPSLLNVLLHFLQFAGDDILVAHPADFDMNFINAKLRRYCRSTVRHHVIDMMAVAYHLFPMWKEYSLDRLANYYGLEIRDRHNSLADARLTAQIWCRFLEELDARGIRTLYSLYLYIKTLR